MTIRPHNPYATQLEAQVLTSLARRKRVGQPEVTVTDLALTIGRSVSSVRYALNNLHQQGKVTKRANTDHDKSSLYTLQEG